MDHLQTESRNPASTNLDELSPLQFVELMTREDAKVAPSVATEAQAIAQAIEVIVERWRAGGRLVYIGAGTSGRLGVLDASECPPTFNVTPSLVVGVIAGGPTALTSAVEGAEDKPDAAIRDLDAVTLNSKDVLVGIATSGRTPYVLAALEYARRMGAYTIALSCNPDSEINAVAELAITPVVGPEVLTGSTRLKAGTATKLVLNLLTTGAMIQMGKTFGNLMVDLRATNEKLRQRANRIIRAATGLNHENSEALLHASGRELKTALVSHLAGVTVDEARHRLNGAEGRVRAAIGVTRLALNDEWILGIDGGGTGTVALLATRDGRIIGRGESGPSNQRAVGVESALTNLDLAVNQSFLDARVPRATVALACLGLAGAGRDSERAVIEHWANRIRLSTATWVVADTELLLGTGWGIAVVAGTGSMVFGRGPDGRTTRAGGWGYLLGDEGSGYAIALAGLRAVARAADGRHPATSLTERLLAAVDAKQPTDMIARVAAFDRATIAALAPVVIEASEQGDPASEAIIGDAVEELSLAVRTAAKSLQQPAFPLALAGGLLTGSEAFRDRFLQSLKASGMRFDPIRIVSEPATGAIELASAFVNKAA